MARSPWRVREVNRVDEAEWRELLDRDPRSLLVHEPRWLLRYVRHHPSKEARWLEARDGSGRLVAGLPFTRAHRMGLVALASGVAGSYGGPVCDPAVEGAEGSLMQRYLRSGGWRTVLREMLWAEAEPPEGGDELMLPIETAVLDLRGGFEEVWTRRFSNNRRNECNRSEKRGLRVEPGRDPAWVEEFLPLYRKRCAEWRTRPLPGAFLREVLEEEPEAQLVRAVYRGRQVGMHFCLRLGRQLLAWVGSSHRLREVFPSTMLVRGDVELGLELGCERLNLGSSLGLGGVARFKKLMGAEGARAWLLRREARWLRRLRRA